MKILFLGPLYSEDQEVAVLKKSKIRIQSQSNSYQWALIKGFDTVQEGCTDILNVLPIGSYPKYYAEIFLRSKAWSHNNTAANFEIGAINIPPIKQIIRTVLCRKLVKNWIKKNIVLDSILNIIIFSNYLPFMLAVKNVNSKVKVTMVVTDLPQYDDLTKSASNPVKKMLRHLYNKFIYSNLKRMDNYVILTEAMKNPLDIGTKPYVVIEGIADANINKTIYNCKNNNKKIILYTGTLTLRLGIINLLDAFALIEEKDYELWICGSGEAEEEIRNRCGTDKRIKYLGYLPKHKIHELQQQASILVNPRANDSEYTKYSFPSKIMEYMLSGKPIVMYKLDGIPAEYNKYLCYACGKTPQDLADKIIEILALPENIINEIGRRAEIFVRTEKNSKVQAKKVIDMIISSQGKC